MLNYEKEIKRLKDSVEDENIKITTANENKSKATTKINSYKEDLAEQERVKNEIDKILSPYKQALDKTKNVWSELNYFIKAMKVDIKIGEDDKKAIEKIRLNTEIELEINKKEKDITEYKDYNTAKTNYETGLKELDEKVICYSTLGERQTEINNKLDRLNKLKALVEEEKEKKGNRNNKIIWFLIDEMEKLLSETENLKKTEEGFKKEIYDVWLSKNKANEKLNNLKNTLNNTVYKWEKKQDELLENNKNFRQIILEKLR